MSLGLSRPLHTVEPLVVVVHNGDRGVSGSLCKDDVGMCRAASVVDGQLLVEYLYPQGQGRRRVSSGVIALVMGVCSGGQQVVAALSSLTSPEL
jgi:hypothetical protein